MLGEKKTKRGKKNTTSSKTIKKVGLLNCLDRPPPHPTPPHRLSLCESSVGDPCCSDSLGDPTLMTHVFLRTRGWSYPEDCSAVSNGIWNQSGQNHCFPRIRLGASSREHGLTVVLIKQKYGGVSFQLVSNNKLNMLKDQIPRIGQFLWTPHAPGQPW